MGSALAIIFGFVGLVVIATLWRAWVLTVLWSWFLVPLSVPAISITSAIGISLIVGMFTHHLQQKSNDSRNAADLVGAAVGVALGGPLVVLLLGWIVTLFM